MSESQILTESLDNLSYFEYYRFRKAFGEAFLIIGLTFAFFYLLQYYSKYSLTLSSIIVRVFYLILILVILFLAFTIKSLKITHIKNGVLVKSKTYPGIIIMIFGIVIAGPITMILFAIFLFMLVAPNGVNSNYFFIIGVYSNFFSLLGTYYVEKKLFFSNKSNPLLKKFSFIMIILTIVVTIIWLYFSQPNPIINVTFFVLAFSTLAGFIYLFLLAIYGALEIRDINTKKRELHE